MQKKTCSNNYMSLQKVINTASVSFGTLLMSVTATPVFADTIEPIIIKSPKSIGNIDVTPNELIAFIINAIIVIGIVLSLIFLLYGGVRWILSGGDKGKIDTARSTIVAAIVGLIIVILAYVIINAVLYIFTGNYLTTGFEIPSLRNGPSPSVNQ